MPSWSAVLREIQGTPQTSSLDTVRRKYLKIMHEYTGRNVIAYYSGFLQKPGFDAKTGIDDLDKNGFMQTIYGLDKSEGLDLILHTPGGSIAATESLVTYLRSIFNDNIRAFVPQMAMSAGTMIALSCKAIVMGKESNLGPIDPQFGGMSCIGVLDAFSRAKKDIISNPALASYYAPMLCNYPPTFLGDCENAVAWAAKTVEAWLRTNMLKDEKDPEKVAKDIVEKLSNHALTFSHNKHLSPQELKELGIKIVDLENCLPLKKHGCRDLQDCVLTIHHAYMQTFSFTNAVKIIENHNGSAIVSLANLNQGGTHG